MLHRNVLNFIDRQLQDACKNKLPFGGKTLILGGDWKQLSPVVEHGTREDNVEASIKSDPMFKNFQELEYVHAFYFMSHF